MERRKNNNLPTKSSPLPADYLKMVAEVFSTNFDAGLKAFSKLTGLEWAFRAEGQVFADEIVLMVSLMAKDQLAATTVYASSDFDPRASSPTVQDLLSSCVDAAGGLFGQLLSPENPENLERLAEQSLSALENVPFEWTALDVDRRKIYLKIDKANPHLDQLADDFLKKNDPDFERRQAEEQEETEKLFVTGPKKPTTH